MRRALAALLAVFVLTVAAWADGGIYPKQAVVKPVRTPDQRALLRWDEKAGTETLVIETTLQGEGTEFAWILPLPAAPKIEASTTGLFPTLAVMCAPRVWTRSTAGWWVLLIPALAVALYLAARRGGIGAWFAVYLAGALVVSLVAVAVPTMQERSPFRESSIRVLSRETVGAFDTATLSTKDAADLRRWLDTNGFGAPAAIDPVVAEYVREGWVFVASKVRADVAADGVRRVHPLAFTFPAKSPVYPMRLTGATNDTLALELFVFGDRRAEADGFDVAWCDDIVVDEVVAYGPCPHAELLRRARGATVLTQLTGTLSGDAMHRDVAPRWTDPAAVRPAYHTAGVALAESGAVAAAVTMGILFLATIFRSVRRRRGREWSLDVVRRDLLVAGVAAVLALSVAWFATPTLPADAHALEGHALRGWPFRDARTPRTTPQDLASARAWAAGLAAGHANPYTDEPIREEDSPGNYFIRECDGRIEFVQYLTYLGQVGEYAVDLSAPRPGSR